MDILRFLLPVLFLLSQTPGAPQLSLSLQREWGYGGFGGQIQGHFAVHAAGPEDLQRVVFYLDDEVLGTADAPPFQVRFVTDAYPLGPHRLSAVGYTASGRELRSNVVEATFVSAEQGWRETGRILLPLLAVTLAALLVSGLTVFLGGRKRGSAPRSYGVFGGAVCPKCGRPFGRHWWAPNMLTAKLDRCPHCGGWSLVRAASPEALRAAEEAEAAALRPDAAPPSPQDEGARLQQALDETRYLDDE